MMSKESPLPTFLRFCAIALAGFLCLSALALGWVIALNRAPEGPPHIPPDEEGMKVEDDGTLMLEIRNGESAASVGRRLEDAGVIRSRYLWRLISRLKNDYLKTGVYLLDIPETQSAIHSILVTGKQMLLRVTIPEGVTLKKTSAILACAGVCGEEEFLAAAADPSLREAYRVPGPTLEGYLYPDTYLFPRDFPARRVVETMADTFFARLAEFLPEALSLSPEELNKRIIIASIVEREYRLEEEAPRMAGVFYNRLGIGMALQSCATVEYVITEIQGRPHPEALLTRDTEIRDPYNTYMRPGLPPGPISAPGKTAILAAFFPEPSDYLYFRLTDPASGRHYFSRTLDGHIRAAALYTKAR